MTNKSTIKINKVTTKTGDSGYTMIGDLTTVKKTIPRIRALASIDMVSSALALYLEFGTEKNRSVKKILKTIQHQLFDLGADLSLPIKKTEKGKIRIDNSYIEFLEKNINKVNKKLKNIDSFTLPASGKDSALLHNLRTTIRVAELDTWAAISENKDSHNEFTAIYLNRLSDLVYVLSRAVTKKEQLWIPGFKNE
jgi:cob(I)alamin adenosyltransferase